MNIKNTIFTILASSFIFIIGCKKDYDSPPVTILPTGNIITIDSLRNIYVSVDSTFTDDISIYAVVSADEMSGNLYKNLYVQDGTNAILLKLTSSSDKTFFEGDSVRIALKGTIISRYKNMLQLDNVDPTQNLIKQSGKNINITPKVVTINDLALVGIYSPYQSQLVQLNNVEFACSDICNAFADPIAQTNQNRTLTDSLGNSIVVRTSGFANFSGTSLPQGKGSFVAIVSQYNTTVQLTIRKLSDLNLTGTRKNVCPNCPFYKKNFDDGSITSGGWESQIVTGTYNWTIGTIGGGSYAQISNYNAGNTATETWLISPDFDLSTTTNPVLAFQNAYKYTGTALKLFITTNYTGNVSTTSWTDITSSATWSTGAFTWTPSGNISLSAYKQAGVRFAFKYVGTAIDGSTWEIDDITLTDI